MGVPSSTIPSTIRVKPEIGDALAWSNASSAVELQPRMCSAMQNEPDLSEFVADVSAMLKGEYCTRGQSFNFLLSRVLYVDKALASLLPQRMADVERENQKKANGDL